MLRQSLGVLQAINIVSAVKWEGPKSTAGGSTATLSANYEPTAVAEVMKRDSWPPSYCGFIGGTSSLAVSCSAHSSCVWNTDYFVVGCCATASLDCLFYTSCIDQNSPATDADDSRVFTCRGTKTCYENNYPSNYRQWGCGYNATSILLTYENMSTDAATIQQAFIGTKELIVKTTATETATSSGTTTATPNPSHGPSTGTIVGAAIGSAALLVIGAVIIAFLFFRHRKGTHSATPGIISSPLSPTSSPNPTIVSGSYFNKDHSIAKVVSTSPLGSSLQTDLSNPMRLQVDHQPMAHVQTQNHDDTIYETHLPPHSPPAPSLSPTPRELDATSSQNQGQLPRKPVVSTRE